MPSTAQVAATLDRLFALLYPGCHDSSNASHAHCRSRVEELFAQIAEDLEGQIRQVLACSRAGAAENSGETDVATIKDELWNLTAAEKNGAVAFDGANGMVVVCLVLYELERLAGIVQ